MAKRVGVTIWWIEQKTGALGNHRFDSPPNNGNYEAEVRIKYANDPIDFLIIPDDRSGNLQIWFDELKAKAEKMRQEIAAKGQNTHS